MSKLLVINARSGLDLIESPGERRLAGYHQRFGVTAESDDEMISMIKDYMYADLESEVLNIEDQGAPDFDGLDREIKSIVGDLSKKGIWYKSGRVFYRFAESGTRSRKKRARGN